VVAKRIGFWGNYFSGIAFAFFCLNDVRSSSSGVLVVCMESDPSAALLMGLIVAILLLSPGCNAQSAGPPLQIEAAPTGTILPQVTVTTLTEEQEATLTPTTEAPQPEATATAESKQPDVAPPTAPPVGVPAAPNKSLVTAEIMSVSKGPWLGSYQIELLIQDSQDIPGFANFTRSRVSQIISAITRAEVEELREGEVIQAQLTYRGDEHGGLFFVMSISPVEGK
jgi:hypothetical protein